MRLLYVLLCFVMAVNGVHTYPRQAITSASPFVQAHGTAFYLKSEPFYFAGTNAFYLGLTSLLTDSQVIPTSSPRYTAVWLHTHAPVQY